MDIRYSFKSDIIDVLTREHGGNITYASKEKGVEVYGELYDIGTLRDGTRYITLRKYTIYDIITGKKLYYYGDTEENNVGKEDFILLNQMEADYIKILATGDEKNNNCEQEKPDIEN